MKSNKKPLKHRMLLAFPLLVFILMMLISSFYLSDLFISFGLAAKEVYYIHLIVIFTFLIGYFTAELCRFVQSKLK